MIVRLKAIKSRENTFRYLSSYLHCSFFWHLVIVTFIVSSGCRADAETSGRIVSRTSARIVAPLDRLQPLNHRGLELLRRSLGNSDVSVPLSECSVTVPLSDRNRSRYYYLVWESFKWSFLPYHLINRTISSEVRAVQDVVHRSDQSRTHIRPFTRIYLRTPAGSSRVTSRPSTFCRLHHTGKTGLRHTGKAGLHHTGKAR